MRRGTAYGRTVCGAVVSGCALIALAGACSSPKKYSGGAVTTTSGRPTTTAKGSGTTTAPGSTKPTSPSANANLANIMVTAVPSGYAQQIDSVADTGPTSLAKAALDDVSANARRALVVTGFQQGYQRLWAGQDSKGKDGQNFVFLYKFVSPQGAAGYAEHWRTTLLENPGPVTPQAFSPAYIPGSVGMRIQDQSGSTGIVLFSKGKYAVQAVVNGAAATNPAGAVTDLAYAQYLALP